MINDLHSANSKNSNDSRICNYANINKTNLHIQNQIKLNIQENTKLFSPKIQNNKVF